MSTSPVFLESPRLWFRAPEPGDVALLTAWINDTRVRRTLAVGRFPLNSIAEREFVERHGKASSPPANVVLVFGLRGEGAPIGATGLHDIDWVCRTCDWGILIGDPRNWNKGYGREAARTMLAYAFRELSLNRVQLRVHAANPGGIKAYEAAGFLREGVMREASTLDGTPADLVLMSALRREWTAHP